MVACDSKCTASCSCTSVIYSELRTTDGSELSLRRGSPLCTCPHSAPRPLQTTTCLPQPLPATLAAPREPDYLRLQRTFISPDRIKPFELPEPQPIYYARSFQKYGATGFDSHYDNLVHLRRYHKSLAEWVYGCDLNTAPLHSVTFLRTSRQAENPPLLVEERRSQPGLADLSTHSDAWGSIYKAMGSRSEPSGGSLEETDSVERLVRVWQEVYVERSWSTELTMDNRVYDSGDDTRPFGSEDERRLDEQEEREEAAGPREDFGLWYRELEQMDRLLDETAISRSNLSCSTARSISVCRQTTTLSSPGCPLVPSTVVEPSPRPQDKSLYCQIRQLFLGGAAQLVKRKETPWKMKK